MFIPFRFPRIFHRSGIFAVAAVILLAGCSSYQSKGGTPAAQNNLRQDLSSCRDYAASINTLADRPLEGIFAGAVLGAATGVNWAWRGWSGEGAWIGAAAGASVGFILGLGSSTVEYNKVVSRCMEQRGYQIT